MIDFNNGFAQASGELEVYLFDQGSGEYLGTQVVFVSEGCGLAPGQALEAPPKAQAGFVAQRVANVWAEIKDQRGTVYRTADGEAVQHNQLGPLTDDLTVTPRPTLNHLWTDGAWVLDAGLEAQNRQVLAAELVRQVDSAADIARERLCGGLLRAAEYQKAATEALAFRAGGYLDSDVPRAVAASVSPSRSAQQAADEILAASERCEDMLVRIREIRLGAKNEVQRLLVDGQNEQAVLVVEAAESELMVLGG